jgi:hypothetical protein
VTEDLIVTTVLIVLLCLACIIWGVVYEINARKYR